MNVELFEKARALGEELQNTEEYRRVQIAQDAAEADLDTIQAVEQYNQLLQSIDSGARSGLLDQAAMRNMTIRAQAMEKSLQDRPVIVELTEAQQAFADLMAKVNQVIRFMITGEAEEESGCGGNCASCGGCGGSGHLEN